MNENKSITVKSKWLFTKLLHTLEIHIDAIYYSLDFPSKNFRKRGIPIERLDNVEITTSFIDVILLFTTRTIIIKALDADLPEIRFPGVNTYEAQTLQQILEPLAGKGVVKFEGNVGP